jgi:hypothetical protein
MTSIHSDEPSPETVIQELHRVREAIVESYGGDLHALTADARRRQEQSGRPVWRPMSSNKSLHRS